MKLRTITVSGWQCFAEAITVGPFMDGINVLHAPNGSGKSTLFGALRRTLFDGHRTSGQEINLLRPWGRDLPPCACIEFEYDGARYRLEKRFLDHPFAKLARLENGKFIALADGDKADEHVRRLFLATAPNRGAARPEHWGLAEVLWVPQGELTLKPVAASLSSHIQSSLGAQVSGDGGTEIEERIDELFATIFTPTGEYRSGKNAAQVRVLEQRLADLQGSRQEILPQVEEFENTSRRVEDLRGSRAQARREEEDTFQQLQRLQCEERQYRDLESKCRELLAIEQAARQAFAGLQGRIDDIRAARAELQTVRADIAQLSADQPALTGQQSQGQLRLDAATKALCDIRAEAAALAQARANADAAKELAEGQTAVKALSKRISGIRGVDVQLAELRSALAALVAPTARALNAIRKAEGERRAAQAALDAALITLQIIPTVDATIDVRVAETTGERALKSGIPLVVRGSPQVAVNVPGFGEIRATGPAQSSDDLRRAVAESSAEFAKLIKPYGLANVEDLAERAARAMEIQADIDQAEARRQASLAGDDLEGLEQQRARLEMTGAAIVSVHPLWCDVAPDPLVLADEWRHRWREHEGKSKSIEHEWQAANEAMRAAQSSLESHAIQVKALARREKEVLHALGRLENDGLDDSARDQQYAQLARNWKVAQDAHADAARQMQGLSGDLVDQVARVQRKLDALSEAARRTLEDEKKAEGRMERIAQLGAYSRLGEIDEQIAETEDELSRERARADGIKLLHDTVHDEQKRAVESVCGPVESLATEIIARIAGPRLGGIKLDAGFGPEKVVPPIVKQGVGLEGLSGGEREQVHLAVRLALADVLSRGGNQLVVLDDVLIATDSGRLNRVQAVLEEFGEKLQILVLTCHPERYRGLAKASYIDLESIVNT